MYLVQHLKTSIPSESMEVRETSVLSKPALFEGHTECKRPKVTINSVTSNYKDFLHIELLLLVTGQNEIQSYLNS